MIPQSITYSAAGGCTTFAFDFPVMEVADLEVLLNGIVQTTGFTLLGGEGANPGGAVRFDTAPVAGTAVTLRRTGRVQVSGSDAPGFLQDKIVAGSHIAVTKTTDAAGEHLTIATDIDPEQFQPRDADLNWLAANLSAAGKALIDDADAAAQRATLGLSTVAATGSYTDLSDKPVLGSAAALNVDTDGALAANSDGNLPSQKAVKTYVDNKFAVAASDIAVDERNLLTIGLMALVNGGYAAQPLFGGACDAFNADTISANSNGQTYDGAGRLYANPDTATTISSASAWSGATGSFTFGIGSIDVKINNGNNFIKSNATFSGDFSITLSKYMDGGGLATNTYIGFGFYPVSSDSAWSDTADSGSSPAATTVNGAYSFWAYNTNTASIRAGASAASTVSAGIGDTFVLSRSDGTVTLRKNGLIVWTFAQSSSGPVRFWIGASSDGATHFNAVAWTVPATPPDMTLVSNALSPAPASAPAKVRMLVLWKDLSGSAVLNTDFTAEATRDGTTWSAGTLSDSGLTIAGFKVLSADIDLAGQPAGTAVKYRLKTLNSKAQQVKGVAYLAK